ncbi:glutathione S-transferase family protein [Pontivivens ytuae]|uniref:Glutathione S-transferase family protein n=2 Tax=Pontivivens ytuae TaxID=2789856 RepID=A0A7S9LW43_9RHOB|nr:glutathione S-transferase family protein [Pontivivens ytuae]
MLYDTPRAPNPRRVRIFLAEKGIELPTTSVDIMAGQQFGEEYLAKMGSHNVPALELSDGTILTETVAVCRYLEALYPEPNLLGRDPLEAARIEMWSRRVEFQLMLPIAAVSRHGIPAMKVLEGEQCPEWAEFNRDRVVSGLAWLERSLAEREWLAGDRFSLADITAICTVGFMRLIRVSVPTEHAATLAWMERCEGRGTMVG